MAVYKLVDFSDILAAVREQLKIASDDEVTLNRIRRFINTVYLQEVIPYARWKWLQGFGTVQIPAVYQGGTVSVTQDSTTVTLSANPSASLGSFKNFKFAVKGQNEVYMVETHTAGQAAMTITPAINSSTDTAATYEIYRDWVALPTDCDETIQVWHDHNAVPLEGRGLQDFRKIQVRDPRKTGRPQLYYTGDFYDPSSGTDELESDRYRQLHVYPSIIDKNTNLHVTYKKQVDALEDDGDEPVLPIEDRIVLVYGALSWAWRMQRNSEEALQNERLFKEKLARMAGKVEDTQDMPQFNPDSGYIGTKRGSRFGHRSSVWSAPGSGGGGGATIVTYLNGVTIDGANITDTITVDPLITIDGRDLSVDGAALDAHIAAASAVHGLSGTVVGTSDAQALTNKTLVAASNTVTTAPSGNLAAVELNAALAELQTDIDTRATSAALTAHESDTSTHGVGVVVGTSEAQALTNKTIVAASNTITTAASGNLTAVELNLALAELQTDIDTRATSAALTTHESDTSTHGVGVVVGTSEVQALTNKTIDADLNTISNIENADIKAAAAIAVNKLAAVTASRVLLSDASGFITASSITTTTAGFIDPTSSIQTQLDAKVAKSTLAAKGDILTATAAATPAVLPVGANGLFLKADSSQSTGMVWASATSTGLAVVSKTTTYGIATADDVILADATSASFTLTLPSASANPGKQYKIQKTDTDFTKVVTIARAGSDTIGNGAATSTTLNTQDETITLVSDGTSKWVVVERRIPSTWAAHTPSDVTLGWMTGGTRNYKWKREAGSVRVKGYISNVGTVSTNIEFDPAEYLPSGLSVATGDLLTINPCGNWYAFDDSAASSADDAGGTAALNSSGVIRFYMGSVGEDVLDAAQPFTWGASDDLGFEIVVPVSGWNG